MTGRDARFLRRFCEAKYNMEGFSKKVRDALWETAFDAVNPVTIERIYGNAAYVAETTSDFIHSAYEKRDKVRT
jgi:hypothetical protein